MLLFISAGAWIVADGLFMTPRRIDARRPTALCFGASDGPDGGTVRDSWAVLTLGDLHMEDDMSHHEQARNDCLQALRTLSILVEMNDTSVTNGDHGDDDDENDENDHPTLLPTLDQVVEQLQDKPARDLTAQQLELILTHKREGDLCHSYLVSLGDLGRKE